MVKSINDLINQPTYVQPEKIYWRESKCFDDEPQTETISFDDNNQIINYPVRQIKIKAIKECLNGYLIESTETKSESKQYYHGYLLDPPLFKNFQSILKPNRQIIISYCDQRILKPELNLTFQPRFGKKICGIVVHERINKSVFIRAIKNIYVNAADFLGLEFHKIEKDF